MIVLASFMVASKYLRSLSPNPRIWRTWFADQSEVLETGIIVKHLRDLLVDKNALSTMEISGLLRRM
jgi:hypothetical protein